MLKVENTISKIYKEYVIRTWIDFVIDIYFYPYLHYIIRVLIETHAEDISMTLYWKQRVI